MIVDIHTHVFDPDKHFGEHLQADLQRCRVDPASWGDVVPRHLETTAAADVAIVFGLQAQATGWLIPNDWVAAHVALAPERLLFFAAIDPWADDYMGELERCHRELGAVGVKLSALYQGVHPRDDRYYDIYRYCQQHGLPILFHVGTSFVSGVPLDYSRPIHYDAIAIDFPELRIVLAHLGHPWEAETIAVIRRNANVYSDISALHYRPWQFYNAMRLAVEYGVTHKILFGSDFPFTTTEASITGMRQLNDIPLAAGLPAIPTEAIEEIIYRDSLTLLGLSKPAAKNT